MLKIHSISLGCPKNRVDSERLLGSLGKVRPVKHIKSADLVFINTCAFISPAIQESVRTILECAAAVQKMPKGQRPLLAVAGCLPGRFGVASLQADLPEVDLWLDTGSMAEWPQMVAQALGLATAPEGRLLSTGPSYAWLKVSEGCGQSCAFCTIPQIRGKVRSHDLAFLQDEARGMLAHGVKELVLVAQDLTSWGRDLKTASGKAPKLEDLLDALLPLPGLARLRLMYLYPAGMTDDFLRFVQAAKGSALLPYFDIPLQHAHPDVLSRMGRPFAQSPFKVVERIRKYIPEAALRTSLIAGFPGETEAQFETLLDFVREARFHNLGVFAYQQEEGTLAANMPDQIAEDIKEDRRGQVMELQAEISQSILAQYLGEDMEVLIDAPHPEWPGLYLGRTWFQAPEVDGLTYVSGESAMPGNIIKASITESFEYDLNALEL